MSLRKESFFCEEIGPSLNAIVGHPKGSQIYRGLKKKILKAMIFAGVKRGIPPFDNPVYLAYFPHVARNKTGHIPKAFDTLNFAITYKIIEDRLVDFGILQDDRRQFVKGSYCGEPVILSYGSPVGIHVVIQEVELSKVHDHQMSFPIEVVEEPLF